MLKYIDLFAGIGGFHCALDKIYESKCVFTSEINEEAAKVYAENFPGCNLHGDIQLSETKNSIPKDFDLLCAGFPCQPFSKSGNLKGFEDTRGTLFFDILEILNEHKPKYILLENVSNLVSHDNGNTYKRITESLKEIAQWNYFGNYGWQKVVDNIVDLGFNVFNVYVSICVEIVLVLL